MPNSKGLPKWLMLIFTPKIEDKIDRPQGAYLKPF